MAKQRLLSLDILRGLTIFLMIIVNTPGSWSYVYAPLLHAEWDGLTPTDFVFPSFLFIVGASIVFALGNKVDQSGVVTRILWRSLKIYLVGLGLWLWPEFDFSNIRYVGVLPRIAIVYLICALIFVYTKRASQWRLALWILTIYTIVMVFIPVPGLDAIDLSVPMKNWAHYIDSKLLPGYLWQETWDPEGLLSTAGAVGTTLLGMTAASIYQSYDETADKLFAMMRKGFVLLAIGYLLSYLFPINKALWSSSFTLVTAGACMQAWAVCIYLFDVNKSTFPTLLMESFGKNPIIAYVLSGILTSIFYSDFILPIELNTETVKFLIDLGLAPKLSSLIYALIYVGVISIPIIMLFKRKIFIRL
jgi:predicted acyltransferase